MIHLGAFPRRASTFAVNVGMPQTIAEMMKIVNDLNSFESNMKKL